MFRTVRIDLAYDGADFHGWQMQLDLRTVQGELARMLERLLGRTARPTGAGRTDAGVHALGQVAHMGGLNADEVARICRALPGLTPEDMAVSSVREVPSHFHARFSAVWRRYEYHLGFRSNIFRRRGEWQLDGDLDYAAMDAGAALIVGEHDFSSFCKASSLKRDNHCTVDLCRFEWTPDSAIFHIRADRFLHHMVRTLVRTLVEAGRGQRTSEEMTAVLAARDRGAAGAMAPPQGLYLAEVGYPIEFDDSAYTD